MLRNQHAIARRPLSEVPPIYAPWFVTTPRVAGYWFCTSGVFAHAGAQETLRQNIKAFFVRLAAENSPLSHLAALDVQVFAWNDFDGELGGHPPLRYRWFGGLPSGLRTLEYDNSAETFRRFLSQHTLPYFSRDAFNREKAQAGHDKVEGEDDIISRGLRRENSHGLIISGPGGVGKTRLALEIGRKAQELGWLPLRTEHSVRSESISALARTYPAKAQVLLVIDYAEATNALTALVHEIEKVNQEGHNFRFVATCRASARPSVSAALEGVAHEVVDLVAKKGDDYGHWVVQKILAYGAIPNADLVTDLCRGMPVLAAFAVFLFQKYRPWFDSQFSDIHRGDEFFAWAGRRLQLAAKTANLEDVATRRLLAGLAARFPMRDDEYYGLRMRSHEMQRLLDFLETDRWIERIDGHVSAAHDIFSDAIIARYVFETPATDTARGGDVLCEAADVGALSRALTAFDRLAAHPRFRSLNGLSIVRRLWTHNQREVNYSVSNLLGGRLLGTDQKVTLLRELPDIAALAQDDVSCDAPLSSLAEASAKLREENLKARAIEVLQPLLDHAVARSRRQNMVLRRALLLIPPRYQAQALSWIRREPEQSSTHFLLVAWLRAGLPTVDLIEDIQGWFRGGGNSDSKGSFVVSAWLEAGGGVEQIEAHVLAWLQAHGTTADAQFVYKSWLDADGGVAKIEAHG